MTPPVDGGQTVALARRLNNQLSTPGFERRRHDKAGRRDQRAGRNHWFGRAGARAGRPVSSRTGAGEERLTGRGARDQRRATVRRRRSSQPTFGSLDFGGGGWPSVFKDLGRTRVVGGALLQGSGSYVPAAWLGSNFEYLADAINARGFDLDLSWGGSVGYDLTNRTVLIGKYLESDNVKSGLQSHPTLPDLELGKPASRTVIGSVAYRTGALRFSGGYRFASTGSISAHAITEGARAQQATSVPAQYPAA